MIYSKLVEGRCAGSVLLSSIARVSLTDPGSSILRNSARTSIAVPHSMSVTNRTNAISFIAWLIVKLLSFVAVFCLLTTIVSEYFRNTLGVFFGIFMGVLKAQKNQSVTIDLKFVVIFYMLV